jgi:arylsulfatase A-like enzyme
MTRRSVLAAPLLLTSKTGWGKPQRPNVVMFMTDDHGAWANGIYGCASMHTPHIDRLAKEGARFTSAYAATPVCSPSRMTYLTGRMPSTHTVQDWLRPVDSFGERSRRWLEGHPTYSEILARAGYTLGMVGKWHMGRDEQAQAGFSFWASVPGGGGTYRDPKFVKNGQPSPYQGFREDAIGDFALEFLEQQKPGNPFYLLVPFYAPHTPYDFQPEADREPYRQSAFGCFPDLPPHPWRNPGTRSHFGNRDSKLGFSALITAADRNAGRVLAKLDEMRLRRDTLVVFTADQGWNAGHHGVWGKGNGTWPFNMYEESIHVPLIWNHPGRIREGTVIPQMVSSYDYFPSLLDYCGVRAPRDPKSLGRSYAPLLRGRRIPWQDRLYFEYAMVRAVRTRNLKYIERTREWPSEFFDLEADPGETASRLEDPAYAGVIAELRRDLHATFERLGAPRLEEWRSNVRQELTVYTR